ncbi:MAG: M14 family zinc carboxypeptidase [Parcubacteria group bacterium]
MTNIHIGTWADPESVFRWRAIRLKNAAGTPTITITEGQPVTQRTLCWASAIDSDTWYDFDNASTDLTTITFSNDNPFPFDPVYVCTWPAYPYSRALRKVAAWLTSPYCSDTTSSTNGVIGASTPRADGNYGRTVPALSYLGVKITDPASVETKNTCVLVSGVHSSETVGNWSLEGAVNFLLSADADAALLRTWFNFYVYPMTNPQGRWAGYQRSQPENAALNTNRQWLTPGALENIDAFVTAITTDTGGSLEAGIDFHTNMHMTYSYSVANDIAALKHPEWAVAMAALEATYKMGNDVNAGLAHDFFETLVGGTLCVSVTDEVSNKISVSPLPSGYTTHGANLMRALATLLADGDFPNGPV